MVCITSIKINDWIRKYVSSRDSLGKQINEKEVGRREISIWDLKGRIIVITEKPKAAGKIAPALSPNYSVGKLYGIKYYKINTNVSDIYIVPAAGHLYGLHTDSYGYPVFNYNWKPLYQIDRDSKHTYNFHRILGEICRKADYYINACDYDIEGSVIGFLLIKFYGDPEKSFRVKFSSLALEELRRSFQRLSRLDWEMIEAGLCRHELDWLWGINISRALMNAVREAGDRRIILSAGRVQTPTLKHVVDNNIARNLYVPLPQYTILVKIVRDSLEINLQYIGPVIEKRVEAEELVRIINKDKKLVVTEYREEIVDYNPYPAFSLGDLQSEAAKIYGYSPYRTQSIAEKLYLDALISYPRTNSQKLPPTINYRSIIENLSRVSKYRSLVDELLIETKSYLKPIQGMKDDPAHPAIYPTGNTPGKLSEDEWRIYDLIVRRFLAAFAPKAVVERRYAIFKHYGSTKLVFQTTGQKIVVQGWLKYYPFISIEERYIPKFTIGERVAVSSARLSRVFTKPPERVSKIKLLKWMESVEIGTESTRARIIELLFKRKYLVNTSNGAEATNIGFGVIEVLTEYFPELTSVDLTRYFEKEMHSIRVGSRERSEVIREARETISNLLKKFEDKKMEIGKLLITRLGLLKNQSKCILCNREIWRNKLCKYHYLAYEEINKKYIVWKTRESISQRDYLNYIKKMKSTGKWIKEVLSIIDKLETN